jgi:wyosine [tRNA(Phe)-imidazoG37] synthetase (radical SAM superfamily)
MPTAEEVRNALEVKLSKIKAQGESIASITFSGNGEPTLHPDFEKIIDDTLTLRIKYFPTAKVTVFSNATTFHKPSVFSALNKVDNNILKFDSAIDSTLHLIDQPTKTDTRFTAVQRQFNYPKYLFERRIQGTNNR